MSTKLFICTVFEKWYSLIGKKRGFYPYTRISMLHQFPVKIRFGKICLNFSVVNCVFINEWFTVEKEHDKSIN